VDETAVQSLRLRVTAQADRCRQCFNQFHCARLCPDAWPSPRPGACRTQAG
jgi:hypothetical protein